MPKSDRPEIEEFRRQMDSYRSIIGRNNERLEEDAWLAKQIVFWMESTRFLITELEIWDELGNSENYHASIGKVQKSLDHLQELCSELT